MWTVFVRLRIVTNLHSIIMKFSEFLEQLREYELFKQDLVRRRIKRQMLLYYGDIFCV
jgi:hypothetical protein